MKVAVTGSNGFIGAALCHAAREEGHNIIPFVRASPSFDSTSGISIGSIDGNTEWGTFLEGVDCVVHCAAHVHRMKNLDDPEIFRLVNTDGTLRLAMSASNSGVKRFVYISTVKVMGEFTLNDHPYSVDDTPAPTDPYGISKWKAEQGLRKIAEKTGLEVVVVRPPLVYGPGVGANFRELMRWIERGLPLPVGSIKNRRSLMSLANLIDFLLQCISHPSASGHTFLVSDGHDFSTPELVDELARSMGIKPRILDLPVGALRFLGLLTGRAAQVERLVGNLQVDIEHARHTLGWTPMYSVTHGMNLVAKNLPPQ